MLGQQTRYKVHFGAAQRLDDAVHGELDLHQCRYLIGAASVRLAHTRHAAHRLGVSLCAGYGRICIAGVSTRRVGQQFGDSAVVAHLHDLRGYRAVGAIVLEPVVHRVQHGIRAVQVVDHEFGWCVGRPLNEMCMLGIGVLTEHAVKEHIFRRLLVDGLFVQQPEHTASVFVAHFCVRFAETTALGHFVEQRNQRRWILFGHTFRVDGHQLLGVARLRCNQLVVVEQQLEALLQIVVAEIGQRGAHYAAGSRRILEARRIDQVNRVNGVRVRICAIVYNGQHGADDDRVETDNQLIQIVVALVGQRFRDAGNRREHCTGQMFHGDTQ